MRTLICLHARLSKSCFAVKEEIDEERKEIVGDYFRAP